MTSYTFIVITFLLVLIPSIGLIFFLHRKLKKLKTSEIELDEKNLQHLRERLKEKLDAETSLMKQEREREKQSREKQETSGIQDTEGPPFAFSIREPITPNIKTKDDIFDEFQRRSIAVFKAALDKQYQDFVHQAKKIIVNNPQKNTSTEIAEIVNKEYQKRNEKIINEYALQLQNLNQERVDQEKFLKDFIAYWFKRTPHITEEEVFSLATVRSLYFDVYKFLLKEGKSSEEIYQKLLKFLAVSQRK